MLSISASLRPLKISRDTVMPPGVLVPSLTPVAPTSIGRTGATSVLPSSLATSIAVCARHDRVAGQDVVRTARFGATVDDQDVDESLGLLLDDLARREELELDELADRLADLRQGRRRDQGQGRQECQRSFHKCLRSFPPHGMLDSTRRTVTGRHAVLRTRDAPKPGWIGPVYSRSQDHDRRHFPHPASVRGRRSDRYPVAHAGDARRAAARPAGVLDHRDTKAARRGARST